MMFEPRRTHRPFSAGMEDGPAGGAEPGRLPRSPGAKRCAACAAAACAGVATGPPTAFLVASAAKRMNCRAASNSWSSGLRPSSSRPRYLAAALTTREVVAVPTPRPGWPSRALAMTGRAFLAAAVRDAGQRAFPRGSNGLADCPTCLVDDAAEELFELGTVRNAEEADRELQLVGLAEHRFGVRAANAGGHARLVCFCFGAVVEQSAMHGLVPRQRRLLSRMPSQGTCQARLGRFQR